MKAALLKDTRTMVCEEVPTPQAGPGEVLVRVAYCGVCGSDVPRFLDGAVHAFPLILGHEFSGMVEEVGQGVDASMVGVRVSGIPLVPCMECADCKAGNYSLCKHYSFIGSRRPGAYAQYVAIPAANAFSVADEVDDMQAAFFEPATVAQHAIELAGVRARMRPDATAVVVGCGTIGIFTAQILQAMGLEVTALARRQSRIDAACSAGVCNLVNTSEPEWDQKLLATLGRGGFDFVFDTSGSNAMMVKSFELAANKARVCMVGTPKRPMQFSVREWENLNRKELELTGSWMSYSFPFPGREWSEVARQFAEGVLNVTEEMIDSVFTLDEIPDGMMKFADGNTVSGKILVDCR